MNNYTSIAVQSEDGIVTVSGIEVSEWQVSADIAYGDTIKFIENHLNAIVINDPAKQESFKRWIAVGIEQITAILPGLEDELIYSYHDAESGQDNLTIDVMVRPEGVVVEYLDLEFIGQPIH